MRASDLFDEYIDGRMSAADRVHLHTWIAVGLPASAGMALSSANAVASTNTL